MPLMPQGDPRPPSYQADRAAIWRELEGLWRTLRARDAQPVRLTRNRPLPDAPTTDLASAGAGPGAAREDHAHPPGQQQAVFSYAGQPALGVESPGWRALGGDLVLTGVWVTCPPGGTATVELLVNGAVSTGATESAPAQGSTALPDGAVLSVRVTAGTTDGVTVQATVRSAPDTD